jgi:importin subunit alpha-1
MKKQLIFQFEAARVLTNITEGTTEDTQLVIDSGAVPLLVEMLKLNGPEYVEVATRALGNIMGDSPSARDVVLAHGVVPIFCEILSNYDEITYLPLLKTVAWAVFNIYRKLPHPPLDVAEMIIKPVVKALKSRDLEIVKDCCCTLSKTIATGGFDSINLVLKSGTLPTIINDVIPRFFNESEVLRPIVRIFGGVAAGTLEQTQALLDNDALPTLLRLLDFPSPIIVKETCFALSNITVGTDSQLQTFLESNFLPKIIQLLRSSNVDIRREALWVIANVVDEQVVEELPSATKFDIQSDLMILKALKKLSALGTFPEQNMIYIQKCVDTLVLEGIL